MKSLSLTFVLAILFTFHGFSQNEYIVKMWEHTTGQPDTIDWSASVKDNSSNTYTTGNTIVTGEKANIITTKYNSSGTVVWEVTYNSSSNDNDYGTAIEVDASGNVYVAAASYINGTNFYDYRVIKYNSSGTLQWNVTYNGTGSLMDIPTNVLLDGSGNVYVTGGSIGSSGAGWDYATIKYNSSGTQQWVSRYNYNSHDDVPGGLAINSAGKILVSGGSAQAVDNWDIASVKLNPSTGATIDDHRNSASGLGLDQVYSVAIDLHDNLYIAGRTAVSGNGYDMTVIKLDSLLSTTWTKTYDFADLDDEARAVVVDESFNIYITGFVTTADTVKNFMTIKYNSSGTLQWSDQQAANNGSWLDAEATDIAKEAYGDIYVTGKVDNGMNQDFMTVMYSPSGTNLWIETWDGGSNGDDTPYFVNADVDGEFYVGGKSYIGNNFTYTLVRYKKGNFIMPPDDDVTKPTAYTYFENKGQLINTEGDPVDDVKYYTKRVYPSMYFMDDTVNYVFSHIDVSRATDDTLQRIAMSFYNSSSTKTIHHIESQGGEYLNFYLAHTGENGITNVRHSEKLYEAEVYPHVDALYYFDNAGLKYYLIIKPGYSAQSDPILLTYDGATPSVLTGNKLELATDIGTLVQKSVDAYQISGGMLSSLAWDATYTISSGRVGFTLGTYDHDKILVLEISVEKEMGGSDCSDENVVWSTIYGGNDFDALWDIKTQYKTEPSSLLPPEVIYVCGLTVAESLFPSDLDFTGTVAGGVDIFVQQFKKEIAPLGDPNWATYFGGTEDDGYSAPYPFAERPIHPKLAISPFDANAENGIEGFYIASSTYSGDIITKNPDTADPDVYVEDKHNGSGELAGILARFDATGAENWCTYISDEEDETIIGGIDIKPDRSIVITGSTHGGACILRDPDDAGPAYSENIGELYVAEFTTLAHLYWGTLYGTPSELGTSEEGTDITVDPFGEIYVCGFTTDEAFPTSFGPSYDAGQDAVLLNFKADRDFGWAELFPGGGDEVPYAIALDEDNDIFIVGGSATNIPDFSAGTSYPATPDYIFDVSTNGGSDGFIVELSSAGSFKMESYLGGDGDDELFDISSNGKYLFITGNTASDYSTFPHKDLAGMYYQAFKPNDISSFITVIDKNTKYIYSSAIGDDAGSQGMAVFAGHDYFYNAGLIKFTPELQSFCPLVDVGSGSFYLDAPESITEPFVFPFHYDSYISVFTYEPFSVFDDIAENAAPELMIAFPNPTLDFIYVPINSHDENSAFFLTDLVGQLVIVKSEMQNDGKIKFDLSALASGIYFLHVSNSTTIKIVKL